MYTVENMQYCRHTKKDLFFLTSLISAICIYLYGPSLSLSRQFSTTCTISAYYHRHCWFELRSWRSVLDTTLCDTVCQCLATGRWFYTCTQISSTSKTDRQPITQLFFKVALNAINKSTYLFIVSRLPLC